MTKRIIGLFTAFMFATSLVGVGFAAEAKQKPFEIIPESVNKGWAEDAGKLGDPNKTKDFRGDYNKAGEKYSQSKDLRAALSSGIVTRDTILILLTNLVKFISNTALVVGAGMFVYAGYLYIISVFGGDGTGKANEAIKNAVIGVVLVIFSYAIEKIVIEAFLS